MQPSLIVTLGNTALQALTDGLLIGSCHGTVISAHDASLPPLFPLYHPASIIYNRSLAVVYQEDLRKLSEVLASMQLRNTES